MDKTININLAGALFQIDDEAFRILRDYLQAINNRFRNVQGGLETIEDIESRIAEIFQSQKGLAGVITKENVESMISIIGKPEEFDVNEVLEESPVHTYQRRRMYRNPDDTIVSGVCGGMGAYLGTDPVLFRILFVLFAVFFGVGFLLYIILWIALPVANNDVRKREMYGNDYHTRNRSSNITYNSGSASYAPGYDSTSRIGNAFNEVFRAIGKAGYIIIRIFLIIIGFSLVLTGFLTILSFFLIFVFHYPGTFPHHGLDLYIGNLPDFLNYIVNPAVAPWIMVLTSIALILPMIALIYWGVKMIFWFKANDGAFSLVCLVLWVISVATLAIILFNEGISFAETAITTSENILSKSPDTLFVITDKKIADLKYDEKFLAPDGDYNVFLVDSMKSIYIRPNLQLNVSDDNTAKVEIRKRSSGRTQEAANKKSESLIYNYRISNDTLFLNEYFTIPSGNKWTADFIDINLYLPEKTILYFDSSAEKLFHRRIRVTRVNHEIVESRIDYTTAPWELRNKYWVISDEGLKEMEKAPPKYR